MIPDPAPRPLRAAGDAPPGRDAHQLLRATAKSLVAVVDAAGGLVDSPDGGDDLVTPEGLDRSILADAYLVACAALWVEPRLRSDQPWSAHR